MSGPHVFCGLGVHASSEKGIDWSHSSVEFAVVCIESIPAYTGVVVPRLLILVYVWLSCRAVVLLNLIGLFSLTEGGFGYYRSCYACTPMFFKPEAHGACVQCAPESFGAMSVRGVRSAGRRL
jgi:hypothetical protein